MGFIDAIYILDTEQDPVFQYQLDPNVPSFSYIQNQLLTIKREINPQSSTSILSLESASYERIFEADPSSESIGLDPVVKLDSKWTAAWCKCEDLYILAVGTSRPGTLEVVSDDEDEGEDDDDDDDDDEGEETCEEGAAVEEDDEKDDNQVNGQETKGEEEGHWSDINQHNAFSDNECKTTENNTQDVTEDSAKSQHIYNVLNPLQYINFFDILAQAMKMMLQTDTLTAHKIRIKSHTIVMLLQELFDASVPLISDLNQLRELLPNDSIIDKLVSATKQIQNTAASSISTFKSGYIPNIRNDNTPEPTNTFNYSTILEKSGNKFPWRSTQVKNAQNEIYIDLYETIDVTIYPKGGNKALKNLKGNYTSFPTANRNPYINSDALFSKSVIHGHIDLTTSLPGSPNLEIQLNAPYGIDLDECYPSLHRAIDKSVWTNSGGKIIELVPPDEKCKLLTYHIDLLEMGDSNPDLDISKYAGSIGVELYSGLGTNKNEFEIVLSTGCGLNSGFGTNDVNVKEIEAIEIEIFLPESASSLDLSSNEDGLGEAGRDFNGTATYGANKSTSDEDPNLQLKVLRSSTGTIIHSESGNSYKWVMDSDVVIGGRYTLRGCIGIGDCNEEKKVPIKPKFLKVNYRHHGSVPSGIKVQGVKVLSGGIKAKPFKGVKYTSKSGDFIVR